MSKSSTNPQPFKELGIELASLRRLTKESLVEVSLAVEIDEQVLERYEAGVECPDIEILNLLINHYKITDGVADQLWELAGYAEDRSTIEESIMEEAATLAKQLIVVLASDGRTIYTDGVSVTYNKNGLQLSFMQSLAPNKSMVVSRLGMSYEQASDVMKVLGTALAYAQYYQKPLMLPPGE